MTFEPGVIPHEEGLHDDPYLFFFRGDEILVIEDAEGPKVPKAGFLEERGIRVPRDTIFIGTLDSVPCYLAVSEGLDIKESGLQDTRILFSGLRSLLGFFDDELFRTAGIASQTAYWLRTHRYCGRCGRRTVLSENERALVCSRCGLASYPRISPAIIVAITRNRKILLARSRRFRTGLYSVLAGFVEPGENLEGCLQREVLEEVGITVTDIRYFASQPWPFPHSLMIAFTARYSDGEIVPDPSEIVDAGWFDKDMLPEIPPHGTIARRLIDWFVDTKR
ncbi:MAG: NAD(+) diphosphatase [Spirochaetes bacterium]|nr:NAD(+) diphosphatase [Spirochaetota bacterium]